MRVDWLEKIRHVNTGQPVSIMNVCGGHERTISQNGLRSILPENLLLIPGPGCPVCVCPEEDIYQAIQLSQRKNTIVAAFGDMLRVPANLKKSSSAKTLEQSRSSGADVRAIASPSEAVTIARQNPDSEVVFFAAGFETTMAPVAAMLASLQTDATIDNLSVLLSGRLTWPAVYLLLDSGEANFDALIIPGHVATVMGTEQWRFVSEQFHLPSAVAGFTAESILSAVYSSMQQINSHDTRLDNCYAGTVSTDGNRRAQKILKQVFSVADANWRGIGVIPQSGFEFTSDFKQYDARQKFGIRLDSGRWRSNEMPAGCDCSSVVLGKIQPSQCKLYGKMCTPSTPVGPCMVSDEGACHIWWQFGSQKILNRTNDRITC